MFHAGYVYIHTWPFTFLKNKKRFQIVDKKSYKDLYLLRTNAVLQLIMYIFYVVLGPSLCK